MITGMCGDGGNDCAALRAATFGFALSESDAGKYAAAVFKSRATRS
jgi:cation-transporting ATPase 13A3/4/5